MTAPRFLPASLAVLASGAVVLLGGAAHALTCAANSDCPKNFSCTVTMMSACPAIACAPGQDCPVCTPTEIHECMPNPCTANADCADGMVCVSETHESCPPTAAFDCAPGTNCPPPPAPEPCTTTTVTGCVPQYLVPCTTDVSCGVGFTCVPDTAGSCSGSGGTAPSGSGSSSSGSAGANGTGGAPAPAPSDTGAPAPAPTDTPPPPDCTTITLATSHCEAKRQECKATSECPTGWMCQEDPNSGVTSGGCAVPVYPDGGIGKADCPPPPPPPPPVLICVPPWFNLSFGGHGFASQASDSGGSGTVGIPKGQNSGPTLGSGTGPLVPVESADAGAGSGATRAGASSSNDSGGCQMGSGRAGSTSAALLGALGLVGLVRRRRFRAA
jgi:MYXO-CTERM domain-containing protein